MEKVLKNIGIEIINIIRKDNKFTKNLIFNNYHGFMKGKIPISTLKLVAKKFNMDHNLLQLEIVSISQDLSSEIHFHKYSHTFCIILGEIEHFDEPKNAFAFKNNNWIKVSSGDSFNIPKKLIHGFTINSSGVLHFLSVQSPPIEYNNCYEDYFKIN